MPVDGGDVQLPAKPGVYMFKKTDGTVMYVGKATILKERIRSYFSNNPDRQMIPDLVNNSDEVDYIVTQNPSEALMLERQLIKKHKPRYNSLLKDDKSYPFIAITSEEIPRIMYSRHPPNNAAKWGPFPDARAAKRVIQLLRRHFGIRDERNNLPFGYIESEDKGTYEQRINAVKSVLDGNAGMLIKNLQSEMDEHSNNLRYEAAAKSRDLIAAVQQTISQQIIHSRFYQDCDAVGFHSVGDRGMIVILHTKEGMIQGQVEYPLIHRGDIGESISLVMSEHYASRRPPRRLLVPSPVSDWMNHWVSERRGGPVEIRVPQRGDLAKLRKMADANAKFHIDMNKGKTSTNLEKMAVEDASKLIDTESLDYVVCFDMAQLQGEERVGACISLRKGIPYKKEYRTFRVKSVAKDDLKMMKEIIARWLNKQSDWPDLVLLDGGETHLNMMKNLLIEKNLENEINYAALAKKEETLFLPERDPILLDRRGRLFTLARDEAHRFVNKFHRKRRSSSSIKDPLENVPGLGAKKLQSLLRHFGGRKGINHATLEELKNVPGIGNQMAKRIIEHLN
ncbi:MAG: hypothetical protein CMB31_04850 [Euryarchaeota archaeon]|nr:hypothetical protein [Euryarchaeota archaeon]